MGQGVVSSWQRSSGTAVQPRRAREGGGAKRRRPDCRSSERAWGGAEGHDEMRAPRTRRNAEPAHKADVR